MATTIYDTSTISLIDGTEVEIAPLKIKYLRQFMIAFKELDSTKGEDEVIDVLSKCTSIAMKQYYPLIQNSDDVQDNLDIKTLYKIIEISAGIKMDANENLNGEQQPIQPNKKEESWDTMDLAKLEAELFLLGIWKDYDHLESCLSMPELTATLAAKRDLDYQEKKFLAAMQGVDLDEQTGKEEVDPWEAMKARVATNGATSDPNDIISFQGIRAAQAGFGIGMGLDYATEL